MLVYKTPWKKKNGKTSRCGQGSSEKSYDDKNRSDATGGCKSNPTRSARRPDMCPAGNTMMMMKMLLFCIIIEPNSQKKDFFAICSGPGCLKADY